MYTLRLTRSLLDRFAPADADGVIEDGPPTTRLGDWYVMPMEVRRRRLLLCTSEHSLLSVVIAAAHLKDLPGHLVTALVGVLHRLDVPRDAIVAEVDAMTSGHVGPARNRSTLGAMRGLSARVRAYLAATHGDVDVAALYADLAGYRSRRFGPRTAGERAADLLRVDGKADDYLIRRASEADVRALQALIDASVRGLGVGYYTPDEIEAGLRYVFGVDTQLVEDGTYFLIEYEGAVVACGGWSGRRTLFGGDRYKSGEDAQLDPRVAPARIRAFFVHPGHARRGLGRRLYEACASAARERGFMAFELMATLPGRPLYAALGFEELEPVAVPTPAGVPLPCVRMRRTIANP